MASRIEFSASGKTEIVDPIDARQAAFRRALESVYKESAPRVGAGAIEAIGNESPSVSAQ